MARVGRLAGAILAETEGRYYLVGELKETLRPGDCCITLEAGDLTGLPDELLSDGNW